MTQQPYPGSEPTSDTPQAPHYPPTGQGGQPAAPPPPPPPAVGQYPAPPAPPQQYGTPQYATPQYATPQYGTPQYAPAPYQAAGTTRNSFAIAGLVAAIIGMLLFGIILGPLGIVFGAVGLNKAKTLPGNKGRGMSIAAIVIGSIATLAALIFLGTL